jgi:hypothetical protein
MKEFVQDIIFVIVMGIFGVAAGIGIISILNAIARPGYVDMLLTLKEKADFEAMATGFLGFLGANTKAMMIMVLIFVIIGFFLVLFELNPNFRSLKKPGVKKVKAIIAGLGGLFLFFLLVLVAGRTPLAVFSYGVLPSSLPDSFILYGVVMSLISGILWLLVGETGWAGDLTSWRLGDKDDFASVWPKAVASFLMGAASGGIAYYFLLLYNWCFDKYFLLVTEVLGKSAEPSLLGWQLLANALMVMLGFSFAIIAGFITVLSARRTTLKARLLRLILPLVLLAVYTGIVGSVYNDAVVRYDFKKKNLAEAVGVPEKGTAVKSVVLFIPEKPAVQEWRMEAAGNGYLVYNNTYALTPENINKIEDYLARRKDGSIFHFAGQDAVMKGYFKLWDTEKGTGQMFGNSDSQILARMVLLRRLSSIPATAENEKYLRSLADEKKWYVGKTPSLRISEAFMHFGKTDEAKVWADKAKKKGADLTKAAFLSEPVVTGASVTGVVKLNGAPLAGTKVALFSYRPKMTQVDPQYFGGFPVDAKTTDEAGRFEFKDMGKGEYVLAVMAEKEQVPLKAPPDVFSVENAPGVIKIAADSPTRSLGDITITVKPKEAPAAVPPVK